MEILDALFVFIILLSNYLLYRLFLLFFRFPVSFPLSLLAPGVSVFFWGKTKSNQKRPVKTPEAASTIPPSPLSTLLWHWMSLPCMLSPRLALHWTLGLKLCHCSSLYIPGWSRTQHIPLGQPDLQFWGRQSSCLRVPDAGVTSIYHHTCPTVSFLIIPCPTTEVS